MKRIALVAAAVVALAVQYNISDQPEVAAFAPVQAAQADTPRPQPRPDRLVVPPTPGATVTTPDKPALRCGAQDGMAAIMAQNFVKRDLRSPSTAKFQSSHRAIIQDVENCKYRVISYVDAQNGFGATIRNSYIIDMERTDKTNWRGTNLRMGN